MKDKLNSIVNAGYDILFGYIAGGEFSEFVKCDIENVNDEFYQGIGSDIEDAFNKAWEKFQNNH